MMSNEISVFQFEQSHVRTIVDEQGNPWFVAKDVAEALGYANTAQAVRVNCRRSKSLKVLGVLSSDTLDSKTILIPESDLYRLITKSKSHSSERVRDAVLANITLSKDRILSMFMDLDVEDAHEYFVYAIQEVETGRVKIGISKDPERRVVQLQTGNSQDLRLLHSVPAPSGFQDERRIHNDAAKYHIRGEWFSDGAASLVN